MEGEGGLSSSILYLSLIRQIESRAELSDPRTDRDLSSQTKSWEVKPWLTSCTASPRSGGQRKGSRSGKRATHQTSRTSQFSGYFYQH